MSDGSTDKRGQDDVPPSIVTAKYLRDLAGPTAHEIVAGLSEQLTKAARQGKRSIVVRDEPFGRGSYDGSDKWKECCEILKSNGFKVEPYYRELQFVDLGTTISW